MLQVEWKLKRGTWRPGLLKYAQSLEEQEVQEASKTAFAAAEGAATSDDATFRSSTKQAISALTTLKARLSARPGHVLLDVNANGMLGYLRCEGNLLPSTFALKACWQH